MRTHSQRNVAQFFVLMGPLFLQATSGEELRVMLQQGIRHHLLPISIRSLPFHVRYKRALPMLHATHRHPSITSRPWAILIG